MSKSLGNHIGVTEPPEEMYGKTMRAARRRRWPTWYELLLGERAARRTSGRATPSARSRAAIVARFHGDEAAAAAEAHFDRVIVAARAARTRSRRRVAAGGRRRCTCRPLIADAFGVSRSEARRLLGAGRGAGSTASRWTATSSTSPRERLDGAVLQVGKRQLPRLRRAVAP